MKKLSGKHFPAAVLKEVNDNMVMEELQQVQELEKELAAQYAAAQADAKRRIAVEQRAAAREIEDSRRNADVEARQLSSAPVRRRKRSSPRRARNAKRCRARRAQTLSVRRSGSRKRL